MNQKNFFIISAIIIGLCLIGLIIYSFIPRASITFAVAPEQVIISINGEKQNIKNGQTITVSPGEINLIIIQDEFSTVTEKFLLRKGESKEVLIALEGLTAAARELLLTPGSQGVIQRIGGKKVEDGAKKLTNDFPLLDILPIVDRFYKIEVCDSLLYPNDPTKIAICVQLFDIEAKQSSLDDITRRGYDVSKYEIIFVDFSYNTLREEAGE